ncbi:spindle pole body component 110-like isoform X2 [Vespa mandarinia]|uniref:spindle pole body component 110-like isoform X2 n=1 Tax=Vespa mandarinia TaxID=7446 RepID=UPI001614DF74|nr:spindle pole body component 110-like isoform X2 [Vespa mandarinia]
MSDKLLIKEKELYRLNKALEIKTRHVLEEIKSITDRRIHDNSSRQNNDTYNTTDRNKRNSEYSMNTNNKLLQNITIERNPISLDTLTEGTSNLSKQNFENFQNQNGANKVNEIVLYEGNSPENKALINFLKSKIDMLYNELKVIQVEYKNKVNDCERLEGENKKLDCGKLKLHNQVASLKETVTKLENNNSNLHEQNLASTTENSNLRKELRDQIRKLQEDKRQGIKHLEKQRLELLQAFKKQLLLIDNLKKQNAFMTAVEHMQLVEEDFSKLLLWKPNNL